MSTIPLRKDEELPDNVISNVDFSNKNRKALITGGSDGPENWLSTLSRGTIFLAKKKADSGMDMLYKYLILEHLTLSTNMLWGVPDGKNMDIWVDTLDFSRKYRLHEVAGQIGLPEEQEEQVSHEQVEQVQSVTPGLDGSTNPPAPEDEGTRS